MKYRQFRIAASIMFGLACVGQAQAGPLVPVPSGSITFDATVAALPVPVSGVLALLVLAVALLLAGLWAVRKTNSAPRVMSLVLPAVASAMLLGLVLAPDALRAISAPGSFDVDVEGPGTIEFEFPASGLERDLFDPVTFWNRSGQTLKITALETQCPELIFTTGGDARGADPCQVGMALSADEVCVVTPPECGIQPIPVGQ